VKISRAFKVELDPTEEQKVLMNKTFGCVRMIYNFGLDLKKKYYDKMKKSLSEKYVTLELTKLKKTLFYL